MASTDPFKTPHPATTMPGENVSFEAFGQDHRDTRALEAVAVRMKDLHSQMQIQGKHLVIGLERSDQDVPRGQEAIVTLHNQGVVQSYCDAMYRNSATPSFKDFMEKHLQDLKLYSQDSNSVRGVDTPDALGTMEFLTMTSFFEKHARVSKEDINVGRGPSKLEEARILQWALENEIQVVGLDPMSDEDKRRQLTGPQSRIKEGALKDVEFARVQGMGERAAAVMNDLSGSNGGCLVAINMGSAHLGSLEVALREQLETRGLKGAEVLMRVPVSKEALSPGETEQQKMESHLRISVTDLRKDLSLLEGKLAYLEEGRRKAETVVNERKGALARMDRLPVDEQALRELIKTDPGRVAQILNEGVTQKYSSIKAKEIEAVGKSLETNPNANVRELLKEKLESWIQEMQEALVEHENDVETAKAELASFREANRTTVDFAQRVEDRINEKPAGIFTPLTQGIDGQYDLRVLNQGERQTVGQTLGIRASSSVPALHQEVGHEVDVSDHSTRAQLKRSGSFTKPGGDSTTTQGTTPSKVVHSM